MLQTLTVTDPDATTTVLRMTWDAGSAKVKFSLVDELREEMENAAAQGLAEWIADERGSSYRITLGSDVWFLLRVGENLQRQFRFKFRLAFQTVMANIVEGESLDPIQDIWHEMESWKTLGQGMPLHDWLGMTVQEFALFKRDKNQIEMIVASRVRGVPVSVIRGAFGESGLRMAARNCPPDVARLITEASGRAGKRD